MADLITVRTNGGLVRAENTLKRIHTQLPKMTKESMREWGHLFGRNLKESARQAGIRSFTGTLYNTGIQWRQRPNGKIGRLFMRSYGIQLDSMRPHMVNLQPSRTHLLAWADQANSPAIRAASARVRLGKPNKISIFVKPHPFIRRAWRRSRPQLRPIIDKNNKKVHRGG